MLPNRGFFSAFAEQRAILTPSTGVLSPRVMWANADVDKDTAVSSAGWTLQSSGTARCSVWVLQVTTSEKGLPDLKSGPTDLSECQPVSHHGRSDSIGLAYKASTLPWHNPSR